MLDLTRADAKGERAKGTVGGSVAVTTYDGRSWESEALLRSDNVDDTLAVIIEAKECEIEVLDVLLKGDTLCSRVGVLDEAGYIFEVLAGGRGDILRRGEYELATWFSHPWLVCLVGEEEGAHMVSGCESAVRPPDFSSGIF